MRVEGEGVLAVARVRLTHWRRSVDPGAPTTQKGHEFAGARPAPVLGCSTAHVSHVASQSWPPCPLFLLQDSPAHPTPYAACQLHPPIPGSVMTVASSN